MLRSNPKPKIQTQESPNLPKPKSTSAANPSRSAYLNPLANGSSAREFRFQKSPEALASPLPASRFTVLTGCSPLPDESSCAAPAQPHRLHLALLLVACHYANSCAGCLSRLNT